MRFLRPDQVLTIISLVGAAATGLYLLRPPIDSTTAPTSGRRLGYVRPQGSDVRLRGERELAWNSLGREANVYRNDRVFTGVGSSALVQLSSQSDFTVEPNSLIVISDEEESTLTLDHGGFFGELKKGARLFVHSKDGLAQIESAGGSIIRLESHPGRKLKLTVLKGEAQVRTQTKAPAQLVKSNSEAEISSTEISVHAAEIVLLAPAPGALIWGRRASVEFNWDFAEEQPARTKFKSTLEIARDPLFQELSMRQSGRFTHHSVRLEPGVYFWRVTGHDKKAGDFSSPVSSFTLRELQAPSIHPRAQLTTDFDERGLTKAPIGFAWHDALPSEKYEFQIAQTPDFADPVVTQVTDRSELRVPDLPPGKMFWRVTSKLEGRPDQTSITAELTLEPRKLDRIDDRPPVRAALADNPKADEKPALAQKAMAETALAKKAVPTESRGAVEPPPVKRPALIAKNKTKPIHVAKKMVDKIERNKTTLIKSEPARTRAHRVPAQQAETRQTLPLTVEKPVPPRYRWFALGGGFNFVEFNQDLASEGQLSYSSVAAPSFSAHGGIDVGPWGFEAGYLRAPGKVKTEGTAISSGQFVWQNFSAEGLREILHFGVGGGQTVVTSLRLGVQAHDLPYISTSGSRLDLNHYQVATLSGGLDAWFKMTRRLSYQLLLRYQQPVYEVDRGSNGFTPRSEMIFDGSLGAQYRHPSQFTLGLFWFGQYHKYDYTLLSGSQTEQGQQQLFFSNLELRLGFEF